MTKQEIFQATTRSYTQITSGEILQAAQRVFELADEPDFRFNHTPAGLIAYRDSWMYLFFWVDENLDDWEVGVQVQSSVTQVTVSVVRTRQRTTYGHYGCFQPPTITTENLEPKSPAIYRLFFARLEYLLGRKAEWLTCPEFEKKIAKEGVKGELFWLCEWTAWDDLPVEITTPHPS